jgi:hypothetical protein
MGWSGWVSGQALDDEVLDPAVLCKFDTVKLRKRHVITLKNKK